MCDIVALNSYSLLRGNFLRHVQTAVYEKSGEKKRCNVLFNHKEPGL